jgi:hypothetical protein
MKAFFGLVKGPTVEDLFFDKYIKEQQRKALQSVYTASSRPVKPGVLQGVTVK